MGKQERAKWLIKGLYLFWGIIKSVEKIVNAYRLVGKDNPSNLQKGPQKGFWETPRANTIRHN